MLVLSGGLTVHTFKEKMDSPIFNEFEREIVSAVEKGRNDVSSRVVIITSPFVLRERRETDC